MSVLCASCGQSVEGDVSACPHCAGAVRLRDRYLLEAMVGQGAAGVTYRARDRDGRVVAVKEMPLRHTDPDLARRMEREARVLGELHHPRIPEYIEHFTQGIGKKQVFYLVQAFVEGPTLAQEMERRRYTETEVLSILSEVCEVLDYLHTLMPPVVHRDVKLKNLIRRAGDGQLVLIDFGAVRDVLTDPRTGGSTVAGTYGYMAPEQYKGEATPRSDLYALGVLGVVLLSRRDPLELVKPDHSLDWKSHVHASAGLVQLIDDLLQADPAKRPASAAEVERRIARVRAGDPAPRALAPVPAAVSFQVVPRALRQRMDARSRFLAILLAVVGSPIGVHWWYLGRPVLGTLSAVFCWTGIPAVVSLAWAAATLFGGRRAFDVRYNPDIAELEDGRAARLASEIEALHALHVKGALSAEEFEREKARLLGHHPPAIHTLFRQLQGGGLFQALNQLQELPRLIHDEIRDELKQHHRDERRRRK